LRRWRAVHGALAAEHGQAIHAHLQDTLRALDIPSEADAHSYSFDPNSIKAICTSGLMMMMTTACFFGQSKTVMTL